MARGLSARATAAVVLAKVQQGESLATLLPRDLEALPPQQRPLAQELIYGTLREWPRLQGIAAQLLSKALKTKDSDINGLILMGIHQLSSMRTPDHAAVTETVAATRGLGKPWAAGLVNGCLRNFQRRGDDLEASLPTWEKLALPEWLWQALRQQWPDRVDEIAKGMRQRPPLTLRVNRRRILPEDYLRQLKAEGIEAQQVAPEATAITLEKPCPVEAIPGFAEGLCSVQDAAAQLAGPFIAPTTGERVLDACAAPGGKTGHLLELADTLTLYATDISEGRLQRVEENLERLGLMAETRIADATAPATLAGEQFSAIMVDAPCSATGVIRRNPDIKVHRSPTDIGYFAAQQVEILRGLWPLLATGGRMLYITCSILEEENDRVIAQFVEGQPNATTSELSGTIGHATQYGVQTLPEAEGADGLYFALLNKAGSETWESSR